MNPDLIEKIRAAINSHSAENGSNTPDWILAEFLSGCLDAFDRAVNQRAAWYGVKKDDCRPGEPPVVRHIHRTCVAGHAYVTDASAPGRCWCAIPPPPLALEEAAARKPPPPDELVGALQNPLPRNVRKTRPGAVWRRKKGTKP